MRRWRREPYRGDRAVVVHVIANEHRRAPNLAGASPGECRDGRGQREGHARTVHRQGGPREAAPVHSSRVAYMLPYA